jgi:hypothetical protein
MSVFSNHSPMPAFIGGLEQVAEIVDDDETPVRQGDNLVHGLSCVANPARLRVRRLSKTTGKDQTRQRYNCSTLPEHLRLPNALPLSGEPAARTVR